MTLGTTTTPLQLALARGHRWLAMLESGEVKSMKGIAIREGINDSYVSRMVNLTTLAPDIVAAKTTYCYLQPRDKQWIALPDQSAVKND